jgi:hypothetical protein
MKLSLRACCFLTLLITQAISAQTTYLTDDELTKEFDRDVRYDSNNNVKIIHSKGGKIELNGQDVRGRPTYDSGTYVVKDGKYCTKWVKSRNGEEACFFIARQEDKIVFFSTEGKDFGWRREAK